jgi:predicted DsbA family dithiol-disulfide isomerase
MRVYHVMILCVLSLGCSDKKAAADQGGSPPVQAPAASPGGNAQEMNAAGLPVDLSDLRDDEKKAFFHLIQKYPSACGKAQSLEQSLKTDPKCRRSVYAARYIKHLLSMHLLESEVEEHYDVRFGPVEKKQIDVSQAPVRGEPSAPVTLVEFSDFQCPHCKNLQPTLERVLDEYRGQVKLYFKNYPIERAHPDAKLAAAAACAAGKQGKFWPFHDKLFGGNQEHEDMSVLEKYAKDLKLDLGKWKSDIEACKPLVEKDHAEGERLDISATPTLYIDGKQYHGPHNYDELKDWIDEELNK